ncbi:ATP-binding protein [Martelella alba]|uniref:tRNA(Ile)-lysidine/2-thiocytidine synthase N-terminal domain-containing protein n=1 Tax=Martelella alba TaxID=2590451 RepID=A0ABY2SPF2_9HYPH|nr:ATP-binding protein [Martelella alba]TKI07483.1 hypothetical protein FCN80_06245 [Martelella alba]
MPCSDVCSIIINPFNKNKFRYLAYPEMKIIVKWLDHGFLIKNNHDQNEAIFIHLNKNTKNITISNNIYTLLKTNARILNYEFLKNFLKFGESYNGTTPWEDIYELLPGFDANICIKALGVYISLNHSFFLMGTTQKPTDILEKFIINHCRYEKVIIEFSGGLDSTALLYAAIRCKPKKDIIALTWHHPDISSKEDFEISKSFCENLGIRQIIHSVQSQDLFTLSEFNKDITIPNLSLMFYTAQQKGYSSCPVDINNYCVLNGHGGDHIFCDPPLPEYIVNAYYDKGCSFALRKLYEFSCFSGIPIIQVIAKIFFKRNRHEKERTYGDFIFNLFKNKKKASLMNMQLMDIIQAIVENHRGQYARIFTPYTCREMINFSIAQPVYETFNKSQKRLPFKKNVYLNYGKSPILRNSKGHLTGIYQKYFTNHIDDIRESINNDKWLDILSIERDYYHCQLDNHENFGLKISFELIHYLCFSVFMKNIELGGYHERRGMSIC